MKKLSPFVNIPVLVCVLLLTTPQAGYCARVETARLFFDKTAYSSEKGNRHTVARGECLIRILRRQFGPLSPAEQIRVMEAVRNLNPGIEDLNRIYPGQVLVVPERIESRHISTYTVRRGDSLTRIISDELRIEPKDIRRTLRLVQQINPDMRNPNLILAGQTLKLPVMYSEADMPKRVEEGEASVAKKSETKETAVRLPEGKLAVMREILSRMNGTLNTSGNYYIPLPQSGQVTIECSAIPLIELDDGTIVALDFGGRMPEAVKKVVSSSWNNYHFLKASETESIADILQRVLNASKSYAMTRLTKPVSVGTPLQITMPVEWMISKGPSPLHRVALQGLNFVAGESQMSPDAVRSYARRQGIAITEIVESRGVVSGAAENIICPVPILSSGSGCDMAFGLLNTLGYEASRNIDVKIFDQTKDGFNLSVIADLLVKDGSREVLMFSKRLPDQFTDILRVGGKEVFFLAGGETRKGVVEKTLTAMRIPFTDKRFSFSFTEGDNRGGGTVTIPALLAQREKTSYYLVDFDLDQGIHCLLRDRWGAKILRY